MQRVYEFYLKVQGEENTIHSHYVTDSSRPRKVSNQIIEKMNKLRAKSGFVAIRNDGDVEEFRLRELKRK